jgi:hypothetical protein
MLRERLGLDHPGVPVFTNVPPDTLANDREMRLRLDAYRSVIATGPCYGVDLAAVIPLVSFTTDDIHPDQDGHWHAQAALHNLLQCCLF